MRASVIGLWVVLVFLGGGIANAQSLEESYKKLCPQPTKANDEACLMLQEALIAKQGKAPAPASNPNEGAADPTWGILAPLVGAAWGMEASGYNHIARFEWVEDGAAIRYIEDQPGYLIASYAKTQITFRPGPEPGTLSAKIETAFYWTTTVFRLKEGGLVSDWYIIKFPSVATAYRDEFRLTGEGKLERRRAEGDGRERPDFAPSWPWSFARFSETGISELSAQSLEKAVVIKESVKAMEAAEARAAQEAKAARRADRAALFSSVVQGVAQGLAEVNTGGYADAQANLDATVADIQSAAAVERQQQALAAQQAQARAAEEQRQQLAANARWVAEKEQAAAEYRSGQVDAAAAREEKLVAQQQAEQQRRASAAAASRSAEQAAAAARQLAQSSALAERKPIAAQPVAVTQGTNTAVSSDRTYGQTVGGGSTQLYVFFILLDGQTAAFEGPLKLTLAESEAMEARLRNEAPSKYGAGATVDRRWRGPGECLFVYQLPGAGRYLVGSGNSSVAAETSKQSQISNGKATIHRDVVCPHNN